MLRSAGSSRTLRRQEAKLHFHPGQTIPPLSYHGESRVAEVRSRSLAPCLSDVTFTVVVARRANGWIGEQVVVATSRVRKPVVLFTMPLQVAHKLVACRVHPTPMTKGFEDRVAPAKRACSVLWARKSCYCCLRHTQSSSQSWS